jgi:hypothetical protein
MPDWKLGVLSSSPFGRNQGSLGCQECRTTSRSISAAAMSMARLPPATGAEGAKSGSSSIRCDRADPRAKYATKSAATAATAAAAARSGARPRDAGTAEGGLAPERGAD